MVAEWHTVTGWLADWREARSARTCTTHWPRRSGQCTWGCAGCAAPSCRARWPRGPSLRAHPPRRSGISLRSSSVASWTCRGSCSSARRRSACWPPARWLLARWPPRCCAWRTTAPWRTTALEQPLKEPRGLGCCHHQRDGRASATAWWDTNGYAFPQLAFIWRSTSDVRCHRVLDVSARRCAEVWGNM